MATLKLMHDLGVPAHILREITVGVVSQLLVRRLCGHCKKEVSGPARAHLPYDLSSFDGPVYEPVGCEKCHQTGYRGRDVIMELLEPPGELFKLLSEGASVQTMVKTLPGTFTSLLDDGLARIKEGVTSISEVERVAGSGLNH